MRLLLLFVFFFSLYTSETLAQFYTIKPIERTSFRIISKVDSAHIVPSEKSRTKDNSSELDERSNLLGFSSPLDSPIIITSPYGYRKDPLTGKKRFHHGIDLRSNSNTVLSMLGGKVKKTGYEKKGLGNYITMKYGDFELTYGHLSTILVSEKDVVPPGYPLGVSGSTGRSTGDHLHLSLKHKGRKTNPLPFLLFIQNRSNEQHSNGTTRNE